MWKIKGKEITMNLGDFGIALPIKITNVLETDKIMFEIYEIGEGTVINKELIFEDEKWFFELEKEDTEKLKQTDYLYSIKQYREGVLQNTINKHSLFKVE